MTFLISLLEDVPAVVMALVGVAAAYPAVVTTVDLVVPPTAISPTSPLLVAVATKVPFVFAPVVNPSANTPENLPRAALVGLPAVAATAVMPDFKLLKAAAT